MSIPNFRTVTFIPDVLHQLLRSQSVKRQADTWSVENDEDRIQIKLTWIKNNQLRSTQSQEQKFVSPIRPMRYKPPSTMKRDRARLEAHIMNYKMPKSSDGKCQAENNLLPKSVSVDVGTSTSFDMNSSSSPVTASDVQYRDQGTDPDPCVTALMLDQPSTKRCQDKEHVNCEIKKVLRTKINHDDATEYLVKWKDHPNTENTWILEQRLDAGAIEFLRTHAVPGRRAESASPVETRDTVELGESEDGHLFLHSIGLDEVEVRHKEEIIKQHEIQCYKLQEKVSQLESRVSDLNKENETLVEEANKTIFKKNDKIHELTVSDCDQYNKIRKLEWQLKDEKTELATRVKELEQLTEKLKKQVAERTHKDKNHHRQQHHMHRSSPRGRGYTYHR